MDTTSLNTGLLSTIFTAVLFFIYKVIKRYTMKSTCSGNQLHITIQDLNEKVDATHEFIKGITTELVNAVNGYKQDATRKSMSELSEIKIITEDEKKSE